jgi:hypothetical protein
MPITYQDLLEKLYEMSPEDRMKPVQLRDYSNQETHDGIDFVPVMTTDSDKPVAFQIGFNDVE